MLRRLLTLGLVAATAAAGLIAVQAADPTRSSLGSAAAADAGRFNPGNLISDENFYDGSAMSAADVYAFLSSRVAPGTGSPSALVNYVQATPTMPATAYCGEYQGSPGESASDIIAKVGAACGISQKAMLVLLEKEQSLVSDAWPSSYQMSAATGFACPDTAPCDSSYGGFFYQVYNAGRQFQVYRAHPWSFGYVAGMTTNILYNPNTGCGSSGVYIENDATAGLYNYTPYQPNRAALSNLYGEGDGCSAYGNRNFWRMYTDWFGDPHDAPVRSTPNLVVADGSDDWYLLADGVRYHVPAEMRETVAPLGEPVRVPQQRLDWTPWGPWVGRVVTSTAGAPSFIRNGAAWSLADCGMALDFGTACENTARLTQAQLGSFEQRGQMTSFVTTPSGLVYLVQSGAKREVPSLAQLAGLGYYTATTQLDDSALAYLPTGAPVSGWGVITSDAGSKERAVLDGSTTHPIDASASGFGYFAPTATMTGESLRQYEHGDAVSGLVTTGAATYLLTDQGLAQVDAAAYGATPAARVSDSFVANLPQAPAIAGAHLVQASGRSEVVLVEHGAGTTYPSAAQAQAAAAARGLPTAIAVTTTALVDSLAPSASTPAPSATPEPTASATPQPTATPEPTPSATPEPIASLSSGEVITNAGGTGTWIVNGDRLLQIAAPAVAADLGLPIANATTVNGATLRSYAGRVDPLYLPAVRCDGVDLLGIDGTLRPYADEATRTAFQLAHVELDPAVCAELPAARGEAIDSTAVESRDGARYEAVNGALIAQPAATCEATAEPAAPAGPTGTPEPTATTEPAGSPDPIATPEPTGTPAASAEPAATSDPAATPAARTTVLPASVLSMMAKTRPVAC